MPIQVGHKIRENNLIRAFCIPFIQVKRYLALKSYINSDSSRYIQSLKGTCCNERCFIIGNGPSLSGEDLNLLKNEKTFAFNRIYNIYSSTFWRPTIYMVADSTVLEYMRHENIADINAEIFLVANQALVDKWKGICNIHRMNLYGKNSIKKERQIMEGISEDVSHYFTISQSVICNAMELAFYMGFKKIYLLGVDHEFPIEVSMDGKQTINRNVENHFALHNDKTQYPSRKEALTKCYEICRMYAKKRGINIYNATRGGKLEIFERVDFDELMKQ